MAFNSYAWGNDGGTYGEDSMRDLVYALSGGQAGVVGGTDALKVVQQATAAATVRVNAGGFVIPATAAGETGSYTDYNDGYLTSPAFTPTGVGVSRKDRVILRVTAGVSAVEIVQGTAAASPTEPSITGDNYLELALVTLPASTSNITDAMITDRRVFLHSDEPRGTMFRATDPNGRNGFTTLQDVHANLTGTFTAEAGRLYVAKCRLLISSGSAGIGFIAYLREGGTTIATLCQDSTYGSGDRLFTGEAPFTATAGSHTYKISVARIAGSGAFDVAGNALTSEFWVEDIGAA